MHRSFRCVATAVAVAAAIAFTPGAALANDAYTAYAPFAAAWPGAETVGVAGASSRGVIFAPGGTLLGAGAESNPFGTSAMLYSFTAGQTATLDFASGVDAFGFFYQAQGSLSLSVPFTSCWLGGELALVGCPAGQSGFFGASSDFSLGQITVTALTDGQIVMGDFQLAGSMTTTPEPGTVALLGTGILALGGFGVARRRRQSSIG